MTPHPAPPPPTTAGPSTPAGSCPAAPDHQPGSAPVRALPPVVLGHQGGRCACRVRCGLALGARAASLQGPTAAVLPVVYSFVVINLVATVWVASARHRGEREIPAAPAEVAVMAVVWVGVFVVMGVLAGAGVSRAVVYGLYPATGAADGRRPGLGGHHGGAANWRRCVPALGVAVVGAVGVVAGPVGAWLVAGAGLFVGVPGQCWRNCPSAARLRACHD